jgi:hypothetical protein
MCIVPGTALTRRPALRANRAGAVPSAGTARKKGRRSVLRRPFRHVARPDTARRSHRAA